MKKIINRTLQGFIGMIAVVIFLHLLCLCLWLLVSFFLWENPIDVLIRGYTNLWKPITHDGWTVANRIAFVLYFILGLMLTSSINEDKKD
jgi:hypothetical protein